MPMWWISNLTPWTFSYYLLCLHSATSSRCQVNFSNFDLFIQNYANFHTVKLIYSTTKSTICVLIIMYLCTIYLDVNTIRERTRSPELKPRLAGGWCWFAVRKKNTFDWWLVAGADLMWEKNTTGWLTDKLNENRAQFANQSWTFWLLICLSFVLRWPAWSAAGRLHACRGRSLLCYAKISCRGFSQKPGHQVQLLSASK